MSETNERHERIVRALRSYTKADEEGVFVSVSRQACEEAAEVIETCACWRPMSEAPSEIGKRVLVFAPSPGFVGVADGTVGEAFLGSDGKWYWSGSDVGYHDHIGEEGHAEPERWMPLPGRP